MCSFCGTKTVGQQHRGWREMRESQMVHGVRHLLYKTAMEKRMDIFGIMILKSVYGKYYCFL